MRALQWILRIAMGGLCLVAGVGGDRIQAASWQALGPEGANFIGTAINPENASQVIAIATDPAVAYRTDDGGATWSRLSEITNTTLLGMCAFDFSRLNVTDGSRCYRSHDGGVSWEDNPFPSAFGTDWAEINHLCSHPTDPNIIYAAGTMHYQGTSNVALRLLKSTDGGQSWSKLDAFNFDEMWINGLAVAKTNPNRIYICGFANRGTEQKGFLFKSIDGGATLTDLSGDLDLEKYDLFFDIAVDPTDADRVYVIGINGLYYSTDGFETKDYGGCRGFQIGIDPTNTSKLYATSISGSIRRSTDFGQNWSTKRSAINESASAYIEVAPSNPNHIYICTELGLHGSKDGGESWGPVHHGINACVVPTVALAPSNPSLLFMMHENKGIVSSEDSGDHWENKPDFSGDTCIGSLLINPSDQNIVLALAKYG